MSKITEQLSQQAAALHPLSSPQGGEPRRSPALSSPGQLRMPALHRAPVFHPPTQQTLDRKDAANYGRLSPPTLTPIQPVSVAGKLPEQQKPPTLLPELREVKSGVELGGAEPWRVGDAPGYDRGVWLGEKSRTKPQGATASVIVRQSTCIKASGREPEVGKPFLGNSQADGVKLAETRDTGRVILPNTNLEEACAQYKKSMIRASQAGVPSPIVSLANSVCNSRTDVTTSAPSAPFNVLNRSGSELCFPISMNANAHANAHAHANANTSSRTDSSTPKPRLLAGAEVQEGGGSRTTSPNTLPSSGTASPAQVSPGQAYPGNFIHLKKHKAALAAAQSRGSGTPESDRPQQGPPAPTQDAGAAAAPPPITNAAGKAAPMPNGQSVPPLSQPNYHKLKKAWLTRHSEEDRNTNRPDKPCSAPPVTPPLEIIKPCTVSLIASTSGETDSGKVGETNSEDGNNKSSPEDRRTRRGSKRAYESGSESGEDTDGSENSKMDQRAKRQPKPTYKKKQNDMQRRKEDDENKPNVIFRSAREKTKLKLASSSESPLSFFFFFFLFFLFFLLSWPLMFPLDIFL